MFCLDVDKYTLALHNIFSVEIGLRQQKIYVCNWIPFRLDKHSGTTFLGDIEYSTWKNWEEGTQHPGNINPYIVTNQLRPSRYALAYQPPIPGRDIYVNVAFISLDSENLYEDRTDYYDFGDNKFPYFKGNTNKRLTEIIEDEEEEITDEVNNVTTIADVSNMTKYISKNI